MAAKRRHRSGESSRGGALTTRLPSRPGETTYPVVFNVSPRSDGTSQIEIGIDLTLVAVPQKRFVADIAGLEANDHQLKLFFGQKKIGSQELRSLLAISMSPTAIHRLRPQLEEFYDDIKRYLEAIGSAIVEPAKIDREPAQAVQMAANIATLSRADTETTIEFYYLPPHGLHSVRIQSQNSVPIDSIVSVDAPLAVVAGLIGLLLDWCKRDPRE